MNWKLPPICYLLYRMRILIYKWMGHWALVGLQGTHWYVDEQFESIDLHVPAKRHGYEPCSLLLLVSDKNFTHRNNYVWSMYAHVWHLEILSWVDLIQQEFMTCKTDTLKQYKYESDIHKRGFYIDCKLKSHIWIRSCFQNCITIGFQSLHNFTSWFMDTCWNIWRHIEPNCEMEIETILHFCFHPRKWLISFAEAITYWNLTLV